MFSAPNIDKKIEAGNNLLIEGNFRKACEIFNALFSDHPNDFRVYLGLARSYHMYCQSNSFSNPGCSQRAKDYYSKAIELSERRDAFSFASYGFFCLDINELKDAEHHLYWALAYIPGNYGMSLGLGITYLRQGRYCEALTVFNTMLKAADSLTKKDRCDLYVNLGATYFYLSEILCFIPARDRYLSFARSYVESAVALNPQNADANLHCGIVRNTCRFFQGAEYSLRAAIQAKTSYPCLANAGLADVFWKLGNTPAAKQHLNIAKTNKPENQRVADYLSNLEQLMQSSQQSSVPIKN
ncbi:MAG: tetratricopeptide repeat protein [Gammaproteobacteria bacterium]